MKKYYMRPQSEVMIFAPEEHVLDKITLPGSGDGPAVGNIGTSGAPMRKINVMYI